MKHIYYKNDFAVEITLLNASGEVIAPPDWQWHIEFTDGRRKYICSVDKGNANVVGNTIMCYLDNHKFCCGEIGYKFVQAIPDLNYLDGFQNIITPKALQIELWEQESDNDVNIQSSVVPAYVVYDAYMTAKANGYTGTAEEYYNAITGVVGIAEAEAVRVSNEELRKANEQQRVREFDAMKAKVDNVYTKAESDARYLRGDWELINEVSEYDTSKNTITIAENCDGYKELAVRRINSNNIDSTNVYLKIGVVDVSLQSLSSNTKDAVWHIVQDGNNLSVKFLTYNFVNTGGRLTYPTSRHEYCINCKIGGKVILNFYSLTTLHDGENIKVYGKR